MPADVLHIVSSAGAEGTTCARMVTSLAPNLGDPGGLRGQSPEGWTRGTPW